MSNSLRPHGLQPATLLYTWDSPGKNTGKDPFSSKRSSQPREQTCISHLLPWQAGSLPLAPPGKPWKLHVKWNEVSQSCLTLCDPVDCSPGSSVHRILQARILEWVAISFSRGSSWPRDQTQVSRIAGRLSNIWATRDALEATYHWTNYYFISLHISYSTDRQGIIIVPSSQFCSKN